MDSIKTLGEQSKRFDENNRNISFAENSGLFCNINKSPSYLKSFFTFSANKNDHEINIGIDCNTAITNNKSNKNVNPTCEVSDKNDDCYPPTKSCLNDSKNNLELNLLLHKISERCQKTSKNDQILKLWSNSTECVDKTSNRVDNNALKLISALLSCNPSLQKSLENLVQVHMKAKKCNKERKSRNNSSCQKPDKNSYSQSEKIS